MSRPVTYQFHGGAIWHWQNVGVMKPRFDAFYLDRDLADRLLAEHTKSAETPDFYRWRATEYRDELAEAIRQHDEYYLNPENSTSYGTEKENENGCYFQEGGTQKGKAAA